MIEVSRFVVVAFVQFVQPCSQNDAFLSINEHMLVLIKTFLLQNVTKTRLKKKKRSIREK